MRRLAILILLLSCVPAMGQQPQDTTRSAQFLDGSVISDSYRLPMVENAVGLSGLVSMDMLKAVPTFLGNTDPLGFVRLLPSVQVNTEVDGGLYMHGCENSHTLISIGGVPIYGVSHLLGFFSVFNSSHYPGMSYSTTSGVRNRLGGHIDMVLPDTLTARTGGDFSVGLLSAQGSLRINTGRKTSLFLSARKTYINLLYGPFLKYYDEPFKYGFADGNITFLWKPGPNDKIWVDAFAGKDNAAIPYGVAGLMIKGSWSNLMGSLHWNHYWDSDVLRQTVYYTTYNLDGRLESEYMSGRLPSGIMTAGYLANFSHGGLSLDADIAWHAATPQNPETEGFPSQAMQGTEQEQRGMESTLSASYSLPVGNRLNLTAGLGGTWYLDTERKSYFGLSPKAEAALLLGQAGKVTFRYGIHRQYLFQTGITNTGLPLEFWVLCGTNRAPQWSRNFSLSHNVDFGQGVWAASLELYHNRLHHQAEYFGSPLEIVSTKYTLDNFLLSGEGYSMGVNLMVQKQKGKLTGWVGYSFNRSRRTFDNPRYPGTYPSEHERPHELDVVATYDWGKVDLGGTFIAASGTPYTRPEAFYVVGDKVFTSYCEHNGSRLPAYIRMDISLNYYFRRTDKVRRGLTLSVYNALARKNAVGFGTHYDAEKKTYLFEPTTFTSMLIPSLSYFHKF